MQHWAEIGQLMLEAFVSKCSSNQVFLKISQGKHLCCYRTPPVAASVMGVFCASCCNDTIRVREILGF